LSSPLTRRSSADAWCLLEWMYWSATFGYRPPLCQMRSLRQRLQPLEVNYGARPLRPPLMPKLRMAPRRRSAIAGWRERSWVGMAPLSPGILLTQANARVSFSRTACHPLLQRWPRELAQCARAASRRPAAQARMRWRGTHAGAEVRRTALGLAPRHE
jgi:hypothetical protein